MKKTIIGILCFILANNIFAQVVPYKNPKLSIEDRVNDLLSRMTLEEKFWQLFMIPGDLSEGKEKYKNGIFGFQVSTIGSTDGAAEQILKYQKGGSAKSVAVKINEIQKYFVEETRLGIPIIAFDEALHGLIREGATAFPQSIGLAATWDTSVVSDVANSIAMEVKTRGIRQILSPVLNIARDVRWGRTEETYGEDPFLTTQIGLAFISEFEKLGVITTPKHFIANVGDGGRDSYPIHYNERLLEEIFFPAFKSVLEKKKVHSVMTSYNSLNGSPCTANNWLLNKKLKDEWNFDGFVISDAGATGGANVLHFTAKDYTEATEQAIESGLDVIFQTSYNHFPLFYEAFEQGMVDTDAINEAVRRVLRAKFSLGLFEDPYIKPELAEKWNGNSNHRKAALRAAQKSIVLLKNDDILPLDKSIKKVSVFGEDAIEGRLGGYSGPGNNVVSILNGIKKKLGSKTEINFVAGSSRNYENLKVISSKYLIAKNNGKTVKGLFGEYYNNPKFEGKPTFSQNDIELNFRWTLFSPDPKKLDYDWYSVRWSGYIVSPLTGEIEIGLEGNDGYRLYLEDELIIDNWTQKSFQTKTKKIKFEKDKKYKVKVEFYTTTGNTKLKLVWNYGIDNNIDQKVKNAVEIAKQSDVAIICAGIEEGEFQDRAYLNLPGNQEQLINEIAKTGIKTVVVLVGGSAITMNKWMNNVHAILDVWYPGEVGGTAVSDVLFGDYNPAGRLPITFPIAEAQLPLFYNHKPTGRGDDYANLTGQPLFPFGYGLSYTKFEYSNLILVESKNNPNEIYQAKFKLKNIGDIAGEEVVQLYIKDPLASVARPVTELKGFQRIKLEPGESKDITFRIKADLLMMLDKDLNKVIEPGEFHIMIGSSSKDIKLRETITIN